ncbi:hypothetical protein [Cysteiniphilum sp. JM-1]|nr:hypothetical protein [Cysteiniphilum sp. JM-1]
MSRSRFYKWINAALITGFVAALVVISLHGAKNAGKMQILNAQQHITTVS